MRDLIPRFFRAPNRQSFFLFGPRGTGKSTWLKEHFPEAIWINLLEPETFRFYGARPERLRETLDASPQSKIVVIDEVQKLPILLSLVHSLMEEKRGIQFILTGSSARKLKQQGVDLLAGRALLRHMPPFFAGELKTLFDLEKALKIGLLPLVWGSETPLEVLKAYVALYLKEEVQAEGLVRDVGHFARFLEAVSFSHGATLNSSGIARECDVSRTTVDAYLQILKDLLLAFTLPIFSKRAKRALSSHPKFYLFDAGVYQSLRPRGPVDRPEEIGGAALEGLVAQHLKAWVDSQISDHQLSFWRTRSGQEVDFVVYGERGFWAIEVKHGEKVSLKDTQGLLAFKDEYPEAISILLYRGKRRILQKGILCLPCDEFLRTIRPEDLILSLPKENLH